MLDFLRNLGQRVVGYIRSVLPTAEDVKKAAEATEEMALRQYRRLPSLARPVTYAVHRAFDVFTGGALRSKPVGEEMTREGLISPRTKSVAEVIGDLGGMGLYATPVGRAFSAAGIPARLAGNALAKAAAIAAENALVGALYGAGRARVEGEPVAPSALGEAESFAFWSAAPYLALRGGGKLLGQLGAGARSLLSHASEQLAQVKKAFSDYLKEAHAADSAGKVWSDLLHRLSGESLLQKAISRLSGRALTAPEAVRVLGKMALAWAPEDALTDVPKLKTFLSGKLSDLEAKALQRGAEGTARLARELQERLPKIRDDVLGRYMEHLTKLYEADRRVTDTLIRAGVLSAWEHPAERYVPLWIPEPVLRQRGIPISPLASALTFTKRLSQATVHTLPRRYTLEEALLEFGPEVVLNSAQSLPMHYASMRRTLARMRFENRVMSLASRTPEAAQAPQLASDLPSPFLRRYYERGLGGLVKAHLQRLSRAAEAQLPEAAALGELERALSKKSISKVALERAARNVTDPGLKALLERAASVRGQARRQLVEQVAGELRDFVARGGRVGQAVAEAADELARLQQQDGLTGAALGQVVGRLRGALGTLAGQPAEVARALKALEATVGRLQRSPRLPIDARNWLAKRLQNLYEYDSGLKRAFLGAMRAVTRMKVLQPFDWLAQMLLTVGGPAGKSFGEVLSPLHRLLYGALRTATGREALRQVQPELVDLIEAGLDIGGTGWRYEAFQELRQPLQNLAAALGTAFDKVTQPIEALAFVPTTNMRIGLALDLYNKWAPMLGKKEAAKAAAHAANLLTGSIDLDAFHPTLRGFLRMLMLAPRWMAHHFLVPAEAAGWVGEATLSPLAREVVGDFLAEYLVNTIVGTLALADNINRKLNNGRHIWENPVGARHLIDITPLVGTGPRGEKQYFDPWFWERDYPRLIQYGLGRDFIRFLEFKMAPLWTVILDVLGYDPTMHKFMHPWPEGFRAALKDLAALALPAGTWEPPGAGFNVYGGWSGTLTGRFDPVRFGLELFGFRFTPGPAPSGGTGAEERVQEAARQGILGKRRILQPRKGQYPERLALEPHWEAWLGSVLGKKPTQQDIEESLDILGLPPEVRKKAIRNIFSRESQELFVKYFRAQPKPAALWHMRLVFAQDNPADRERVLEYLFQPEQLEWLAKALGRPGVTAKDVWQYHRWLLRRERPEEATLGPGSALRRVQQRLQK